MYATYSGSMSSLSEGLSRLMSSVERWLIAYGDIKLSIDRDPHCDLDRASLSFDNIIHTHCV